MLMITVISYRLGSDKQTQVDRQIGRQTDRQTDIQASRQTDRMADRQAGRWYLLVFIVSCPS